MRRSGSIARFPLPDRLSFPVNLGAVPRRHRLENFHFLAPHDVARDPKPRDNLLIAYWFGAGETGSYTLSQFPEPFPENEPVLWNVSLRAIGFEGFVSLSSGLPFLVLDAVVSRRYRYGFAEPAPKLFVKFARSSDAAATWS